MTVVLNRSDLLDVLDPVECVRALRDGFAGPPSEVEGQRVRTDLPFPGTATGLLPGLLPGIDAYTVKVNAKFPAARPALRGVICLHSGEDGTLLALLDSATVTAWRTGLAAALGTHLLAAETPGKPAVLGVVGAGTQADLMLRGLRLLRQEAELVVYDTAGERAQAFVDTHGGRVAGSASGVAHEADIVLLATWATEPVLGLGEVRAGQHLTTLGADEPGKRELDEELLRHALVVVDDRRLARDMGALATDNAVAESATTLDAVLRGDHPGRTRADQLTVYAPVGLPWQDLAISWLAYRAAVSQDRGRRIDLLA